MRSSEFGVIKGVSKMLAAEISLEMFRRMCIIRYFELGVANAIKEKLLNYPVYLSSGQEAIPAALSFILQGFDVFSQHRCHGIYLSLGGDPEKLRDELLGLPGGTSGGRAGSNCIQGFCIAYLCISPAFAFVRQ